MTANTPAPVTPPPGLRARVLEAAIRARAAGQTVPAVPEISPIEAFSRAADALYGMLCALDSQDWQRPVLRDLDVQGLVGHLTGVEEDVHRSLSGDPEVADANHIGSTQPAADRQAGRTPEQTRTEWREAADRTLSLVAAHSDLAADVAMHGMRLPVAALMVVRAFELWIHDNDIRRVTSLPPAVPDGSTLRLMSGLAAGLLPVGAALTGLAETVSVHLVLTGHGGGTWDVGIGDSLDESLSVGIVLDVVGFCRLVGNRVVPADLDLHVIGDADLAGRVLTAASALALD
ncbi:MAG TPA: maleylpyruvate isomerase family mycothiol-dependent enzyme [Streptosporangiaceae bacterium]|nr:maleylpyruvate isomerase family mycothiol-dependent enzyme [Streptosporangiaceae bacterium]